MQATRALRAGHYKPMIKFIGKHRAPASVSHAPAPHPAAPTDALPDSFAQYRAKAQSHGPLGGSAPQMVHHAVAGHSQIAHGIIGAHSGRELGRVAPQEAGVLFDRSQLPSRFARLQLSEGEMEAIESGGATLF